ncbi:unnamed protein product [Calypogeia fissa]
MPIEADVHEFNTPNFETIVFETYGVPGLSENQLSLGRISSAINRFGKASEAFPFGRLQKIVAMQQVSKQNVPKECRPFPTLVDKIADTRMEKRHTRMKKRLSNTKEPIREKGRRGRLYQISGAPDINVEFD